MILGALAIVGLTVVLVVVCGLWALVEDRPGPRPATPPARPVLPPGSAGHVDFARALAVVADRYLQECEAQAAVEAQHYVT